METCSACTRANPKHVCAGCTQVLYCGAECAKADWKNHLTDCKPIEYSIIYAHILTAHNNSKEGWWNRGEAWIFISKFANGSIKILVEDLNDIDMKNNSHLQYPRNLMLFDIQHETLVKLFRFLLYDDAMKAIALTYFNKTRDELVLHIFIETCRLGLFQTFKLLVDAGFGDPNRPTGAVNVQKQLQIGFIQAAGYAKINIVTYLVKNMGVDPTFNNYEVLYNAIDRNFTSANDIVVLVLQDNRTDTKKLNAGKIMTWACENNYIDIVRVLLNRETRFDIPTIYTTGFYEACDKGYVEIVKLLLQDSRVFPQSLSNYGIRNASKNGFTEVVRVLLQDQRVDPSADDNTALKLAVYYGHTEIVRLLLHDQRVDPGAGQNYAIKHASLNGHLEIVNLLLKDPRVDPSSGDNYAVRWASGYGHVEVVRRLLQDKRVDPSANNNNAVKWAAENGHTETVRLLLQDPRVDPSDSNNNAIKRASLNGHMGTVKLLYNIQRVRDTLSQEELQQLRVQFANYMNSERKGY